MQISLLPPSVESTGLRHSEQRDFHSGQWSGPVICVFHTSMCRRIASSRHTLSLAFTSVLIVFETLARARKSIAPSTNAVIRSNGPLLASAIRGNTPAVLPSYTNNTRLPKQDFFGFTNFCSILVRFTCMSLCPGMFVMC